MSSSSFQAPTLEALAELLPAYEFESFIAQGGMGAVYKARQRSLDRDVAIKVLPRELGDDPEFKTSFETEARAMARLNHPNLVGVYDSGEVDGMLYIVMEFVNGKPLYYSAYNTAIDPHQAAEIVKGICDGLAHAHEHGVIHRDIKPANILLTPKREPKIGDFGLAQPVEAEGPGLIMGTPGYAAPELTENPELAGSRSDIFAVGVILYELLTGQRPDEGLQPPSALVGCDRDLDVICHKATYPDPAGRYPDAAEMAKALDDWMKKPVPAGPRKLIAAAPKTAAVKRRPTPTTSKPIKVKGVRKPAVSPLGAAPGAAPGTPPATAPPMEMGAGGNATLVRNLVIIAVLLVAIAITWKTLQRSTAEREAANQALIEAEARKKEEAKAIAEANAANMGSSGKGKQDKPEPVEPPKVETPRESLERLKFSLADGKRAEMPVGAIRRGNTENLLIEEPMTWQEAGEFAEAHGGHLPLVTTEEDLSWLSSLVPEEPVEGNNESALWIGAGRSGRDSWSLVDGSLWKLEKKPVGAGQFVAIDINQVIRVRKGEDRYPFVIQWQRDGSNPASLESVLARTKESLGEAVPSFPPGTLAYDSRHVLIVLHEATADDAEGYASIAGGHLAVPGTRDEAGWLSDQVTSVKAGDGLWIGGVLDDKVWKWTTGETWDFALWEDGYPQSNGTAMTIHPGKGWQDADPSSLASGFIIEWSNDSAAADAAPPAPRKPGSPAASWIAKSRKYLGEQEKDRQKKLADNAKKLEGDLERWLRRLGKASEITRWTPEVESVKQLIEDNRVPEKVGKDSGIRISAEMSEILEGAAAEQKKIDGDFMNKAMNARDHFIGYIKEERDGAEGRGQSEIVKELDQLIEEAQDLEAWIQAIGSGSESASAGDPKKKMTPS
ncbi:protein kinase domain-containing protein [Luteolibacter marinus]|uniref:protein kinase domain-containing protein n=1 Tax=Luteolibacter marinus TaxID=2776705 RepID=UPI0018668E64|nr:protein kinase [Luteolibacter marinus]